MIFHVQANTVFADRPWYFIFQSSLIIKAGLAGSPLNDQVVKRGKDTAAEGSSVYLPLREFTQHSQDVQLEITDLRQQPEADVAESELTPNMFQDEPSIPCF